MALKTGYSHDDAFDSGYLRVSDLHTVHYYQHGKKDGKPGKFFNKICRDWTVIGGVFNIQANNE